MLNVCVCLMCDALNLRWANKRWGMDIGQRGRAWLDNNPQHPWSDAATAHRPTAPMVQPPQHLLPAPVMPAFPPVMPGMWQPRVVPPPSRAAGSTDITMTNGTTIQLGSGSGGCGDASTPGGAMWGFSMGWTMANMQAQLSAQTQAAGPAAGGQPKNVPAPRFLLPGSCPILGFPRVAFARRLGPSVCIEQET